MTTPTMTQRVEEYLSYRRALGYQLHKEGQRLRSFARFAEEVGHHGPLTTEIALRWARQPAVERRELYQARRLQAIHPLAAYLSAREPGAEIPPRNLLGPAYARRSAFICTEANIAALIPAARGLGSADALRRHTYATLIGLLACTGLRIGEALALRHDDIDWSTAVLTVRSSKFHKSRLAPLPPSAMAPLRNYAEARDRRHPPLRDSTFFVSDAVRPLHYETVGAVFHDLVQQVLPEAAAAGRLRPRLHDLRHTPRPSAACWPGIATGRTSTGPSTTSRPTSGTPR